MCVFCAAIPVAVSLGAKAQSDQMRNDREAGAEGKPVPLRRISAGRIAAVAVGGLVIASVINHTHLHIPI